MNINFTVKWGFKNVKKQYGKHQFHINSLSGFFPPTLKLNSSILTPENVKEIESRRENFPQSRAATDFISLKFQRIETSHRTENVYLSSESLDCLFGPRCSNRVFSFLLVQRSIVELLRAGYARQHLRYRKQQSTKGMEAKRQTEFEKLSDCAESQDLVSYQLEQDQKESKHKSKGLRNTE